MANLRQPGPMCTVSSEPVELEDGTLCRCASPLPGTITEEPEESDNFRWPIGVDASKPLGEEAWFEQRYPNLLEDARLKFLGVVNQWVQGHWGKSPFEDQKQRISVAARDTSYQQADGAYHQVKKSDNRFERCGDQPQNPYEADKVLGAFWLDIETPFDIKYSNTNVGGKVVGRFQWQAVMYVGDVLGLQEDNQVVHKLGKWTLTMAPSRKVKRARWYIASEGLSYVVASGDSLARLAAALTGNEHNWPKLYELNRSRIADPNRLSPGQRIAIPPALVRK